MVHAGKRRWGKHTCGGSKLPHLGTIEILVILVQSTNFIGGDIANSGIEVSQNDQREGRLALPLLKEQPEGSPPSSLDMLRGRIGWRMGNHDIKGKEIMRVTNQDDTILLCQQGERLGVQSIFSPLSVVFGMLLTHNSTTLVPLLPPWAILCIAFPDHTAD